jgi:hypothetical protein
MKLVKERGWKIIELNVISRRTYRKNVSLPTNIADGDFWTNLDKLNIKNVSTVEFNIKNMGTVELNIKNVRF